MEECEKSLLAEKLKALRPRMIAILKQNGVRMDEGEDLIQDTVYAALKQWDQIVCLEAWCLIVIRNRARDRNRRQSKAVALPVGSREELEGLCAVEEPPQLAGERWVDILKLSRKVLNERAWRLLQARYGEGYSTTEVAEMLGFRDTSIRKTCRRALARLAEAYAAGSEGTCQKRRK
jgi:RNA polymerase sigma factor (sigma-70 family)